MATQRSIAWTALRASKSNGASLLSTIRLLSAVLIQAINSRQLNSARCVSNVCFDCNLSLPNRSLNGDHHSPRSVHRITQRVKSRTFMDAERRDDTESGK